MTWHDLVWFMFWSFCQPIWQGVTDFSACTGVLVVRFAEDITLECTGLECSDCDVCVKSLSMPSLVVLMWRQQWKPDRRPCIDWVKESLKQDQIELTSWCGCHYHVWRHSVPLGLRLRDMWRGKGLLGLFENHRCGNLIGSIISKCVFILQYVCLYDVCHSRLLLVSVIIFTKVPF